MLNNLLLKIFLIFIDLIDSRNKKVIYFFKKNLIKNLSTLLMLELTKVRQLI